MEWEVGNRKWEIGNGKWSIYRTSPEHPTNINRKSFEHPLQIHRRYIEDGKCSENLAKFSRKSTKHQSNAHQTSKV